MKRKIDTTRASRDGHEYHEIWTARMALQLFSPDSNLVGISIEGLSPDDKSLGSKAAVEIADIALYYGAAPSFEKGAHTTIAQFKYSIANKDNNFRASDAKKTISKFAKTYIDYKKKYGGKSVSNRLDFQLVTNQPIFQHLVEAIEGIAKGSLETGETKKQCDQFKSAAGLSGKPLAEFASKVSIIGRLGSLRATKGELSNLLVDWSATTDPIASKRLGRLKELVREKAGYIGTDQNLITRPDILWALGVGDDEDLLPCKERLTDVGPIVEREQLSDAVEHVETSMNPVLIHAAGGVGKTVFMKSLESKFEEANEVVFFDCFGGGAYRSLDDARHQLKQGLIHIVNTLSFRGFCDPMLPEAPDNQALINTFRRRLTQCVKTITKVTTECKLVLLIDAIDNAEIAARQRSEDAFPIKILESLDNKPIDGVKVIVSCRSHRKPSTHAKYNAFELRPFSKHETRLFLRARLKGLSDAEINVAHARSGGNPRVLDYLVLNERGLLDDSEIDKPLELNDLIQKRMDDAFETAIERGYEKEDIQAFLAGLAVLPPPVPLDEYAGIHGIEFSSVESFASDMAPLLERTNQGLTFKDEPTETLVRERYASSKSSLLRLAENLFDRQVESVYASRALPGLLYELNDGDRLLALALDERMPASITSIVGKRNIRYARLRAATLHATQASDYDRLVHLLVELSTVASVDQRGASYILENPDLVVAANDDDAIRRLFETRSGWPGARHARLAIVNTLTGDSDEAFRHVFAAHEWIQHANRNREVGKGEDGPGLVDIAAIPFSLISSGSPEDAANYLNKWFDWYAFEVCEYIFTYSQMGQSSGTQSKQHFIRFIDNLSKTGQLAAALSFCEFSKPKIKELVMKLAQKCRFKKNIHSADSFTWDRHEDFEDGLRKASVQALVLGLDKEALTISLRAKHDRPGLWYFRDSYHYREAYKFIFRVALVAAAKGNEIHEKDLLPKELAPICKHIPKSLSGHDFRKKAQNNLSKIPRRLREREEVPAHPNAISPEDEQSAQHFLAGRLEPLLDLTKALSSVLAASSSQIDQRFVVLIKTWERIRKAKDSYLAGDADSFFQLLGLTTATFVLWSRRELKEASILRFLAAVHGYKISPSNHIRIVAILARRKPLLTLAGKEAKKAWTLIQSENEVTSRADLYSDLARAMLPASVDEASFYFGEGLEQMDAIGSGDYEFTNELLLFASKITGDELDECDFHTLSNIAELNMSDEPSKFDWGAYGRGLANVAGLRGLAKLSRWADRSRIPLSNTLLPYLIGLVMHGKIEAVDALAINRLANPVEYYYNGTEEFADAIREQVGADPEIITALIEQYRDNNPGTCVKSTVAKLASLADEALGSSSELSLYLADAQLHNARVLDMRNDHRNYNSRIESRLQGSALDSEHLKREALDSIINDTDPADKSSLVQAITEFNKIEHTYDLKDGFFVALRAKLDYAKRGDYLRHVSELEHLFYYWKIAELTQAKEAWIDSSAGLDAVLMSLAVKLIQLHAYDLISDGSVSSIQIIEISDLTGMPSSELVLELIKVYARPGITIPGAAWLTFASFICPRTTEGQGQTALTRLLNSDAANLANNVKDGAWNANLYPNSDINEVASGLVWSLLGSPEANSRWHAAHSIRDFAAFGRWKVIDMLVAKLNMTTAGPFQASELKYYYMHGKLWLLISLARLSIDYPDKIAKYKDDLLTVVTDTDHPHVLMRHFALQALTACVYGGMFILPPMTLKSLLSVNKSPFKKISKKQRRRRDFYHGRASDQKKPAFDFDLGYNFHKYDVESLSQVFDRSSWGVADMISGFVHGIDPQISAMYESDGRQLQYGRTPHEITTKFHTYGQQLGWHALFLAAGQLLASTPVVDDQWYDDPWNEWLGDYLLTRDDGLWLSDGTDRTPLDTYDILLESKKDGLVVTGDQSKILNLVAIDGGIIKRELVVDGHWYSADNIRVKVSSSLVEPGKAEQLARKVLREKPIIAWMPVFDKSEDSIGHRYGDYKGYTPWIVCPSGESRLDEHDPYGVSVANHRAHLANEFATICNLASDDPFGRVWHNSRGKDSLYAQSWGRDEEDRVEDRHPGQRLFCRDNVLKKILDKYGKDLLILIKLERYEKQIHDRSHYTHSVAVVRISKFLNVEYFEGRVNHLHEFDY